MRTYIGIIYGLVILAFGFVELEIGVSYYSGIFRFLHLSIFWKCGLFIYGLIRVGLNFST